MTDDFRRQRLFATKLFDICFVAKAIAKSFFDDDSQISSSKPSRDGATETKLVTDDFRHQRLLATNLDPLATNIFKIEILVVVPSRRRD